MCNIDYNKLVTTVANSRQGPCMINKLPDLTLTTQIAFPEKAAE